MGRAVSSHPMYQMPDKWKEGGRCIGGGDANADLAHPAPLGAWIWQGQRVAQGGVRAERRQQRDRRPALLISSSSSRSTGSMLKRTAGPPSSQSRNPWARKSCWKALWDLQRSRPYPPLEHSFRMCPKVVEQGRQRQATDLQSSGCPDLNVLRRFCAWRTPAGSYL